MSTPPKYPAGERGAFVMPGAAERAAMIAEIADLPALLTRVIAGLDAGKLGTKYVNWNSRQIISHLADSHMNAFIRFKLALTEENPSIKPYNQSAWAQTVDADGDPTLSIKLLDGLHARWLALLNAMTDADFRKTFYHPEADKTYTLAEGLHIYSWHGRHHAAQIQWMRQTHGW